MSPIHLRGPSPERGPAPAYRLATDTPAEIAADLARLCAGGGAPAAVALPQQVEQVAQPSAAITAEVDRQRDGDRA